MSEVYNFFNRKELSREWPSKYPEDIPFANFTCKLCGKILMLQTCGQYSINEVPLETKVHQGLMDHLMLFHTVSERKNYSKKFLEPIKA